MVPRSPIKHFEDKFRRDGVWIPAYAGMTKDNIRVFLTLIPRGLAAGSFIDGNDLIKKMLDIRIFSET